VIAASSPTPAPGALGAAVDPALRAGGLGFAATLLFVFFEYLRPQDWIGPLAEAPLHTLAAIPLLALVLAALRLHTLRDPLIWIAGGLVAFSALWTPFASNRFWAFETFKFLALALLTILAMATFVDRPSRLRALLALLLVAFTVQGAWALGHGGTGLTTHFGDENDLALGMNVALPFTVFGAFAARRLWPRAVLLAASGVLGAAVVASASRGGIVALGATALAMLGFARRRVLIAGALAAGAVALIALAPADYWADMNTMFDRQDATRVERIRSWEQAQAAWVDNPVFGVGPGNIPWVIARYESFDTRITNSLGGRAVHSLYLTVLAEFGLVGVALYGAAIAFLLARCVAIARGPEVPGAQVHAWARAIACSTVAWLVGGVFLSVLYYPHLYVLIGLAIATHELQQRAGALAAPPPARRPWATPLGAS